MHIRTLIAVFKFHSTHAGYLRSVGIQIDLDSRNPHRSRSALSHVASPNVESPNPDQSGFA